MVLCKTKLPPMADVEDILATDATIREKANRYVSHELRKSGAEDNPSPMS
jgi:hypothetical protein